MHGAPSQDVEKLMKGCSPRRRDQNAVPVGADTALSIHATSATTHADGNTRVSNLDQEASFPVGPKTHSVGGNDLLGSLAWTELLGIKPVEI